MAETGMWDMMKQARDLQKQMSRIQKKVGKTEITASSGGGMVSVVINGKLEVRRVRIEPELLAGGDAQMVEDLIAAAVNAAIQKAQDLMTREMKQVTGGLSLPGMS